MRTTDSRSVVLPGNQNIENMHFGLGEIFQVGEGAINAHEQLVLVTLTALAIRRHRQWLNCKISPQLPREWYAAVVLWNYGENRPERQMAGCLRWGAAYSDLVRQLP